MGTQSLYPEHQTQHSSSTQPPKLGPLASHSLCEAGMGLLYPPPSSIISLAAGLGLGAWGGEGVEVRNNAEGGKTSSLITNFSALECDS